MRLGLAFFLGTLQDVRWTPKAAALSPLYVEEEGLGALPTRGLSKLCWVKRSSSFFGNEVQADTWHVDRYCMLRAQSGESAEKAPWGREQEGPTPGKIEKLNSGNSRGRV